VSSYTDITSLVPSAGAEYVGYLAVLATLYKAAGNSFKPMYTYILTTGSLLL
jgi:hypothetical protein